jgi:hypothetical protein
MGNSLLWQQMVVSVQLHAMDALVQEKGTPISTGFDSHFENCGVERNLLPQVGNKSRLSGP